MQVNVIFSIDLDPIGTVYSRDSNALEWFTIGDLINIRKVFQYNSIELAWFLRADYLIKASMGDLCWQYDWLKKEFEEIFFSGDVIGWHPHLEKFNNEEAECNSLISAYQSILKRGFNPKFIRIGEGRGSNSMMQFLDSTGIMVDCSAIPGRFRCDVDRKFDWRGTPNNCYKPSFIDYRISGSPSLTLFEFPISTSMVMADYDAEPMLRYIDLSYRNDIFINAFNHFIKTNKSNYLHFIFHPETVVSNYKNNGLYEYGFSNLNKNITYLVERVDTYNLNLTNLNKFYLLHKANNL